MKEEKTLTRTKGRPVTFMGEEIIHESTKKDKTDTRWWDVIIYATDDGYIAGIGNKTNWVGERDALYVIGPSSKEEIVSEVRKLVPQLGGVIFREMNTYDSFRKGRENEVTRTD